jgi:hypothetical protein
MHLYIDTSCMHGCLPCLLMYMPQRPLLLTYSINYSIVFNLIYLLFNGFQVLLGLSGVLLVMLSVLSSVGFFSAVGVKSTLIIMEVIPFLVLAVSFCLIIYGC